MNLPSSVTGHIAELASLSGGPHSRPGTDLAGGAWGAAAAMMYGSFFGQLVNRATPDASGLPVTFVLAVKAVIFALCLAGLAVTLRSRRT